MAPKVRAFLCMALLLCSAWSFAAATRSEPPFNQEGAEAGIYGEGLETTEICDEECLMRRTLNAHIDYIYTQKHKNP